jgi:hypothetical protein
VLNIINYNYIIINFTNESLMKLARKIKKESHTWSETLVHTLWEKQINNFRHSVSANTNEIPCQICLYSRICCQLILWVLPYEMHLQSSLTKNALLNFPPIQRHLWRNIKTNRKKNTRFLEYLMYLLWKSLYFQTTFS